MGHQADIQAEAGAEHRASPRTNLMLAATVRTGGRALPVRIRNLSETGALLEGNGLPDMGGRLILERAEVQLGATIAWASGNRRGIRFDGPIAVNEWTGGKPRPLDCTGLRDQRRVDAIQAAVRSGTEPGAPADDASARAALPGLADQLPARLAEELGYVKRLLESMGDELVGEPIVVQRHFRALQSVDLASQILAHIATIIVADDQAAAVDEIGMEDLRARLKRKPIVPD